MNTNIVFEKLANELIYKFVYRHKNYYPFEYEEMGVEFRNKLTELWNLYSGDRIQILKSSVWLNSRITYSINLIIRVVELANEFENESGVSILNNNWRTNFSFINSTSNDLELDEEDLQEYYDDEDFELESDNQIDDEEDEDISYYT